MQHFSEDDRLSFTNRKFLQLPRNCMDGNEKHIKPS